MVTSKITTEITENHSEFSWCRNNGKKIVWSRSWQTMKLTMVLSGPKKYFWRRFSMKSIVMSTPLWWSGGGDASPPSPLCSRLVWISTSNTTMSCTFVQTLEIRRVKYSNMRTSSARYPWLVQCVEITVSVDPQKSRALRFFHALTGCDTISAFVNFCLGNIWNSFLELIS